MVAFTCVSLLGSGPPFGGEDFGFRGNNGGGIGAGPMSEEVEGREVVGEGAGGFRPRLVGGFWRTNFVSDGGGGAGGFPDGKTKCWELSRSKELGIRGLVGVLGGKLSAGVARGVSTEKAGFTRPDGPESPMYRGAWPKQCL